MRVQFAGDHLRVTFPDGLAVLLPWPLVLPEVMWGDHRAQLEAWMQSGAAPEAADPPSVDDIRAERDRRDFPIRINTGLGFDADIRKERDARILHGLGSIGTDAKLAGETGAVIWFRDADNIDRWLTPDQARALGRRYGDYITAVAKAKGVVEAKLLAGTITTLDQIRAAPDWPDPMVVPAP